MTPAVMIHGCSALRRAENSAGMILALLGKSVYVEEQVHRGVAICQQSKAKCDPQSQVSERDSLYFENSCQILCSTAMRQLPVTAILSMK